MARIVLETALGDPDAAGRLLGTPETVEKVAVLSIVADRGLCGGYNTMVFRATERLLHGYDDAGTEWRLFTVGKKAQSYFRYRDQPVEQSFTGMSERPTFTDARAVAAAVLTPFVNGEVDQVMIVTTRFLSAGSQKVEVRQLLPLVDPRAAAEADEDAPVEAEGPKGYTEFEPDAGHPARRPSPPGPPRRRSSAPCSRRRPPRSPPASGPWPPPPTTPTS